MTNKVHCVSVVLSLGLTAFAATARAEDHQCHFEQITIPAASGSEPTRPGLSIPLATEYLENGAIAWLKSNQRESGRWWTRSLNTDSAHFITYSRTAYPLLALQMCDAMPPVVP